MLRFDADHLVRGALWQTAALGATAGLGFLFWLFAARVFTSAEIGAGSALVSAALLIGALAQLGLNTALPRYLTSVADPGSTLTRALVVVAATAAVVAVGYLLVVPAYAPELAFARAQPGFIVWFSLVAALVAVDQLVAAVFVVARRAQFNVAVDGVLQGVAKVVAVMCCAGAGAFGVFGSVGAAVVVVVFAELALLTARLGWRPRWGRTGLRALHVRYAAAAYVSNVLVMVPAVVLPLIVVRRLGSTAAGHFYVAFQFTTVLAAIALAVGQVMLAEAGTDRRAVAGVSRRAGLLLAGLQIPVALGTAVLAEPVLGLFGPDYRAHSTAALQILALGSIVAALNVWACYLLRMRADMVPLIGANAVVVLVCVGLAELFAGRGIEGVCWAWVAGNAAGATVAVLAVWRGARTVSGESGADDCDVADGDQAACGDRLNFAQS